MEDCCLGFNDIYAGFSRAARLLGFVVIGLFLALPAQAQETPANSDLKSSLNSLSTSYEEEVKRLDKRHQESKALFDDGLISRVDFEKDVQALADARAKVEQVAKEIRRQINQHR